MPFKIKNAIEQELTKYIRNVEKLYSLRKTSPLLFKSIKDFISRKGKRIRPILFVIGYLGFAKKKAAGLYRSAISMELLHDFMLVHDDIIDKSAKRRGKPSMHAMLNKYLTGHKNIKFNGQDLTIVVGDVMFAMSMHAFLSIREDLKRKEAALKKLLDAAMHTGTGEFIELLSGLKSIDRVTKQEVYKIYDFKTANYTFASPLSIGAILAGANQNQIDSLFKYGIYLGRAFQIKDDILGIFAKESEIGKPALTDLQEAKKTILIWYAYHHSNKKDKIIIRGILSKEKVKKSDLLKMRKILIRSGALNYTKKQVLVFMKRAQRLNASTRMHPRYKELLSQFSSKILNL